MKPNDKPGELTKSAILGTLFLCLLLSTACSQQLSFEQRAEKLGLEFVADVPLEGGATRFDYQSINATNRMLYIAHMGSGMVTVFDIDSGKVIKNIPGLPNVHGIIAVPGLQRVYATATGKNEVAVIDENSLQVISNIGVGDYPDGLAYAPIQKRVFISDEHGETVSVVDAMNNKMLKKIEIGGEVGNTHYDSISGMVFSADQSNNQLVAISPQQMTVTQRYDLPGCQGAHGFYIDEQTHYALITGESNSSLVVLDLSSGEIIARDKVGQGPDVLAFDNQKHLLFVSSESGNVSVFKVEQGSIRKTGEAFFYTAAHSVSIDQNTHLAFFPLQNVDGKPVLRIMRIL
jgi:YVTN family beta-propeller protein